ncbi:serine hydrolase domain-containing protein [Telmatobacter bradus]|uniref:serine hydrolase domain-containing protein n=1 Tax=Telmatobacter bradus TaxID=474953 RepID=UPI003B42AB7D
MRVVKPLFALALLPAFVLPAQSLLNQPLANQTVESIDPALRMQIDRIATQTLAQTGVPSASVAVVQHGKLVYTHAYGLAHLDPNTPATPELRYSIGSVSKQFTAAAILLLAEQGKLKLDDPVGKYVPGLTEGDKVTIRQVLSHTSGYQDYWPEDYLMTPMLQPESAQQILDTWGKKPLDFTPGAEWQYSNTNYVIAGRIVEAVTGRPLTDLLVERVFRPLGMTSVWNSDEQRLTSTDATAYYRHALGPLRPAPKEGRGWMFAAGELAMTAHDLALWDASLISQSLLSPESYKKMFEEVKLTDGKGSEYGLGVEVLDHNGHRSIEHSGEVSGFVSDNVVLVDDGAAVVVLTNQDAHGAASTIAHLVAPLAAALKASPEETQALALYHDLLQGKIDRSLLAPNLSDYFTDQALADYKASLEPLGEPLSLTERRKELRGGMTFRSFDLVFPSKRLRLTTYTYPDGKLEQYLIEPVQ